MLKPSYTKQFHKDIKLIAKRGKNLDKLKNIVETLTSNHPLDKKNHDHPLKGNYSNRRECHIEPDWLLIYKKTKSEIIFERTGTHSDLFK